MQSIYKKYLIKINKFHLFFILLIFLLINFLYFFSSKNCRTYKSILAVYDLGLNQLIDCYSIYKFKTEIKITLKNHPLLYNLFKKIYHTNILYEDYNIFQNYNKNINFKFDKKPTEIKGLIDDKNFKNNSNAQFPKLENDDWFRSHGGNLNHKYSQNGNINRNNIDDLKLAWKYTSINQSDLEKYWKRNIQLNPIFINNKIIFVTPDWKIVALEGHSGKKIWSLQSVHSPSIRGIVSEIEKLTKNEIIFLPVGNKIYKIDAKNGKRIKSFGKNGYVSTTTSIAPIIYNDFLISINFSGFIDLFNKYDGEFISSISIHPKKNFRGGNPWSGGAFDYEKGLIFVNTGNPHPGIYGVNRPGDNKNSSSVVAIDVNNKKIKWTFQETSHDLWDFDIASPPIIHNLKIDKIIYEVVILLSKTGNTIVLERNTGHPIFDIIFEKVPKSDVYGEIVSDYQIKINKPEPFSNIVYGKEDFQNLSEEKKSQINKIYKNAKAGWYEPPSFKKDLIIYGIHGGAEWQGGALDPVNQNLYIPVNRVPWIIRPRLQSKETIVNFPDELKHSHNIYVNKCASCHGKFRNGEIVKDGEKLIKHTPSLVGFFTNAGTKFKFTYEQILKKHQNIKITKEDYIDLKNLFNYWDSVLIKNNEIVVDANANSWHQFLTSDGLPAQDPPYGYLAKLNLPEGKIIWKSPIGYQKIDEKNLRYGSTNFGGAAINSSDIIFYTGTDDRRAYAIDSLTGKELWSFEMEAAGSAPPIIYNIQGKQYVSFLATGGSYHNYKKKGSTIYTFSLEK